MAQQMEDQERVPSSASQGTTAKPTVLEIHGYRLGRSLGHGSYATVKEAYSGRHKCKVAVKIISKRRAPQDYLDKFLPREIDVVKLLKHPSLVVFLQCIETNNRVYLVMECANGGDLLETIRECKIIKERQAGLWFHQLIDAMDYCHIKGVVHRDLKCENLLLDEFNNLKVTDFGFARANMQPKANGEQVMSETYCGSYAYAPPEILTGTPYVSQCADVWSMGVILYVMVFGRLPFDDSNHKKLLRQVHKGPNFPEKSIVAADCRDMITRILKKKENRLTIAEIRRHPWYKRVAPKAVEPPAAKIENPDKTSKGTSSIKASRSEGRSKAKDSTGRIAKGGDAGNGKENGKAGKGVDEKAFQNFIAF